MKHRALRGRIAYLHDRDGERGREWFSISVQDDGTRTLRAQCEMDDEDLLRDVTYTVDGSWRPLDAFVRLTRAQRFVGSAWFRFDDQGAECESWTASEGRLSQRVALSQRPRVFAPHPLVVRARLGRSGCGVVVCALGCLDGTRSRCQPRAPCSLHADDALAVVTR